jgi:protein-L-isoaspartate(D-aspartate) O-methyltransferase
MNIDFARARETMVEQQIRPWDVVDVRVLETLMRVPRHAFVPEAVRALAYADLELPLGHGQVMMKPVVEARALQSLGVQDQDSVLEIGTGSGYLTACLAQLGHAVTSLEYHADLAESARARLQAQGIGNVQVETADVFQWTPSRSFDVICVTGAVAEIPDRFLEWLTPQGRLFAVRGREPVMEAVLVHRNVNAPRIDSLFETTLPYLLGAEPTPTFVL